MVLGPNSAMLQYTDTSAAGFEYKAALTADLKSNPLVASVHDVGKHPKPLPLSLIYKQVPNIHDH